MALNLNQIENLLVKKRSESSLAELIIAYAILKQKLEKTENHSWYFKKGIESKRQEMSSLNNDYEKIRELFNDSTLDFFIHKINENDVYLSPFNAKYRGFIHAMICNGKIGQNEFFTELIRLKSKTEILMPIDYYLENTDEFLEFLN